MLLVNAAAGIYVSGKVDSLLEGLPLAAEALDSGRAFETLRTFVKATGGNLSKLEDNGRSLAPCRQCREASQGGLLPRARRNGPGSLLRGRLGFAQPGLT